MIFYSIIKQKLIVILVLLMPFSLLAQTNCTSDKDYDFGTKHGLKMAPKCSEISKPPITKKNSIANNKFGLIKTTNDGSIVGSCIVVGRYFFLTLQPIVMTSGDKQSQYLNNYLNRMKNMVSYIENYEKKELTPSQQIESYNSYVTTMELVTSTTNKSTWINSWNYCAEKFNFEKLNIS
jgi:hypothetical protein